MISSPPALELESFSQACDSLMDSHNALHSGFRFANYPQYEILKVLGTGGFAFTYLAEDHNLTRKVAIKELFPPSFVGRAQDGYTVRPHGPQQAASFDWAREGFIQEGRTLAKLAGNESIVEVYQIFEANGTAYLVMACIPGESMEEWRKKHGRPKEAELRELTLMLLRALRAVHQIGYLHRDVTPGNILMDGAGRPVLIDFGNSRMATGEKTMMLDQVLTPGYAPPEQYRRKSRQGPVTDIYSLGAVLYFLLHGKEPEDAPTRQEEDTVPVLAQRPLSGYSRDFLGTIDRALKIRQEERWQNAQDWMSALVPGYSPTIRPQPKPVPQKSKNFALVTTVLAILIVAGGMGAFAFIQSQKSTLAGSGNPQGGQDSTPGNGADSSNDKQSNGGGSEPPPPPPPPPEDYVSDPQQATKARPYRNSLLKMRFVPVNILSGPTQGHRVLVCIHETRVCDYEAFAKANQLGSEEWRNPKEKGLINGVEKWTSVAATPECPVVGITHEEAVRFCNWLSTQDGRYHYRLPTNEEWSSLVGSHKYPWGDDETPTSVPGNYAGREAAALLGGRLGTLALEDKFPSLAPVQSFAANEFGLFDVGGNAAELTGTPDPTNANAAWVARGGSWATDKRGLLASKLRFVQNDTRFGDVGFRCVIDLDER